MPQTPPSDSGQTIALQVQPEILLDNPSPDPVLDFSDYAGALSKIIENSDPQFSIGIFGGWGSGKTTLMKAIDGRLGGQTVRVWFNAWRYEKEEHLIVPLLDVLRDRLITWATEKTDPGAERSQTARDKAKKAAAAVGKSARAIVAALGVKIKLPIVELSVDADKAFVEWRRDDAEDDEEAAATPQSAYHASFKALARALCQFTDDGNQRIVIFIDDLDRCLPPNALQVLESMKLFFDQAGVVFVVGLDRDIVEAAIDWHYRRSDGPADAVLRQPISGAEYIKKLFQVPFTLPAVSPGQIDEFLAVALPESSQNASLRAAVRPHLDFLGNDQRINPREIKRYVNSYILQKLIDENLDDDVSFVLQTIIFRADWQIAYQVLQSDRRAFIEATKHQLRGEEPALRELDPRLGELPESFFEYLNSESGRKLATISPDRLDQQVRVIEATRTPASGVDFLQREIEGIKRIVDRTDFSVPGVITGDLLDLRGNLTSIEDELTAMKLRPELRNEATTKMRDLRNNFDTIIYFLRKNDMTAEDFQNILKERSAILDGLDGLAAFVEFIRSS